MKPIHELDEFEAECIVCYLARTLVYDAEITGRNISKSAARRLRSRALRFVLSHPQVTPRIAKQYRSILRGADFD